MAFAQVLPIDGFIVGSFLLAFGGTYSFVPSFHLSNTFPAIQGIILALITGAFDASSAVFLIFRLIYDATNGRFGIRTFFLIYLSVPVLIFVSQICLMPDRIYETRAGLNEKMEQALDPMQDIHDSDDDISDEGEMFRVRSTRAVKRTTSLAEIRDVLGTPTQQEEWDKKQDETKIVSGVWGALHGQPAWKQIQSSWFILITLFTVLQMARFNFFISTIFSQYEYMLQSAKEATEINRVFDVVLPIGGVATVPFIGLLLDNISTSVVLALLVLMSTLIGVLGAVPTLSAAYGNVFLFCVFRPLYYSAMSDYAAKVFGFTTFGTVYGTIICLSGVAVFTQPALQALVHTEYQDDPGPLNLWLAGLGLIIGIALVMYVDHRGRTVRIQHAEEDERRSITTCSRRPSMGSLRDTYDERRPLLQVYSRQPLTPVEEGTEQSNDYYFGSINSNGPNDRR